MRSVSFYCAIPGFFMLSIDSVGTKHPKSHNPKRGQGLKPTTRAKAKGQSSDGSTRGILKGGIIRAGASYYPLEPASLLTFLPEQESKAPAGSARSQFRTEIFCESLLPLQCPVSLLRCSRCTDQSPPCQRGVVWRSQTGGIRGLQVSTLVCILGECPL